MIEFNLKDTSKKHVNFYNTLNSAEYIDEDTISKVKHFKI